MLNTFRRIPRPRAVAACIIFFVGGCGSDSFEIVEADAQADGARGGSATDRAAEGGGVDTGRVARRSDAASDGSATSAASSADGNVRPDGAVTGDGAGPVDGRFDSRGDASSAVDVNVTPAVDSAAGFRDATDGRDTSVAPLADAAATSDAAPLGDVAVVTPVRDAADVTASSDSAQLDGGIVDAGARDVAPEATCSSPRTFYRDRDRDGFGSVVDRMTACEAPLADDAGAWVTVAGDCRDDLPGVRPDVDSPTMREERYTGAGFMDPTKPSGISFDLNCDGVEDGDPAMSTEPDCPFLLAGCSGEGYVPDTPQRNGPTINVHCGSTTVKRCVTAGLICREELAIVAQPYRCH